MLIACRFQRCSSEDETSPSIGADDGEQVLSCYLRILCAVIHCQTDEYHHDFRNFVLVGFLSMICVQAASISNKSRGCLAPFRKRLRPMTSSARQPPYLRSLAPPSSSLLSFAYSSRLDTLQSGLYKLSSSALSRKLRFRTYSPVPTPR
jgi:hypothetical protein